MRSIGHIPAIEGLRGVAVLWVIAFHYRTLRADRLDDPWLALIDAVRPLQVIVGNGYLGVDLFFLITGFLLTLPWFRGEASVSEFYRRRARRILPAYYVHLALLFLIVLPLIHGFEFWGQNRRFTLGNLAAHATFLHYFTPLTSASLGLNGALWTLALEAQYYLLLPLLAPLFVRAPWRTAGVLIVIALAWRWQAAHGLESLVRVQSELGARWSLPEKTIRHLLSTQLPGYLAHFAVGVLAGRAWLQREESGGGVASGVWLAIALLCAGLLYYLHGIDGRLIGDQSWILIAPALGLVLHTLVTAAPAAGRLLLANAPLQFAGRVSYSAYLYHLPALLVWNRYGPRDLGWLELPAYLALVLGISWLSYRYVEQPFLRRKPTDPWPKNAVPGASEARPTSPTTIASGDAPSTTTASSSNS